MATYSGLMLLAFVLGCYIGRGERIERVADLTPYLPTARQLRMWKRERR
jgi:hypothetical protein